MAPGHEQWPRGGQTDQQGGQGEGHGTRPQGLVQVEARGEKFQLSTGSLNVSSFVPVLTLPNWVPDSI